MKPKHSSTQPQCTPDEAFKLPGIPTGNLAAFTLPQDKVILIVDKPTALRLLGENRSNSLPS